MADPVRSAAKAFEVNPRNFDAWDQGAVRAAAKATGKRAQTGRTPGSDLEDILEEALGDPVAKVGNRQYISDVSAILRQYIFNQDPYKRITAQRIYGQLSPENRQRVDALIVAGNPNAQSNKGLSAGARELLEALNGKPMSSERERAVIAAADFEGYTTDQRARDANFGKDAPPDRFPAGDPNVVKAAIRNRLRQEGVKSPAQLEKLVAEEYKRIQPQQRAIESEPEKRPRFSPRGGEQISVAEEGLAPPALSVEQRQRARDNFPAWYEKKREDFRSQLQAETVNRSGDEVRTRKKLPNVRADSPEAIKASLVTVRDSQRAAELKRITSETANLEGLDGAEIAKRLAIDPAEWPGLDRYRESMVNRKYPDYRTNPGLLERDADNKYQIRKSIVSPEGIEEAVNRRYPPLSAMSQQDIDAKIDEIWQGAHEQRSFGRSRSPDRSDWSLPVDDSAAIAAGEKYQRILDQNERYLRAKKQGLSEQEIREQGLGPSEEVLTDGEMRAIRAGDSKFSMSRRDRSEIAPSQTYAENFTKALGFDPWTTAPEFNSSRSLGRPSEKPDNIPGLGQNRTRQSTAGDGIGRNDDSPAFDEAWDPEAATDLDSFQSGSRLARGEQAKELAKMEGIEQKPLKGKSSRGASAGTIKGLSKSALENLYTEMLRAAGVEQAVRSGGGGVKDLKSAFLKPPAAHGFTDPSEMADFAMRVLDKDKPVPPGMRDTVKAELTKIFSDRWGEDLGLSSLPKAGGQPVGSGATAAGLRDRLAGRAPAATPAPVPSAPAPSKPQLDPNWQNQSIQDRKRIEQAQARQEELEKQVESWPEDVESMEFPPQADAGFGNEDYDAAARDLIGEQAAPQQPKPTQVGQPEPDVVDTGTPARDPNELLQEAEDAPAMPTAEELRSRLTSKPGAAPAKPAQQSATQPTVQPTPRAVTKQPGKAKSPPDMLEQYIKDAARHSKVLSTAPEDSSQFQGAVASYQELRRQLQALSQQKGAEPIAQRWASEVIGPIDAAIQKRFPGGLPSGKAVTGDLTPTPSTPIDPLESASKTEVGASEGLALPTGRGGSPPNQPPSPPSAAGSAPTPPPVPPTPPKTGLDDARAAVRDRQEQIARAIQAFKARNGRAPNRQEMSGISDALTVGRMEEKPIKPFADSVNDFSRTARQDRLDAERTRQQMEIDTLNRQLQGQPTMEDLPLPEGAGRSADPRKAAQDTEQAASNVDAAKATKDAESDKATAVAAKASGDADTQAAAKRAEDAANTSAGPQPPKTAEPGKPSILGSAARGVADEFAMMGRYGSLYPFKRGLDAGVGATKAAVKWGPLAALAGYGLNETKDSWMPYVPESLRGPLGDAVEYASDAVTAGAQGAAAAARSLAERLNSDEPPAGNAPGEQPASIIPASMPGGGLIPGDGGINMVPPGPGGYIPDDSVERIRRIISSTRPPSRQRPGTLQRASTYYE
jgi:hypothetical protein